jgi:hypothetical protein
MVRAPGQSGQTSVTPGESVEPPADANEPAAPFEDTPSTAHESRQRSPSVPWHILFPPGHPMHGAGQA